MEYTRKTIKLSNYDEHGRIFRCGKLIAIIADEFERTTNQ